MFDGFIFSVVDMALFKINVKIVLGPIETVKTFTIVVSLAGGASKSSHGCPWNRGSKTKP
jgi:hypothetical protein